jgi:4-amino-4-deoxy-L-arabinose transferase-like glycosyltransferase
MRLLSWIGVMTLGLAVLGTSGANMVGVTALAWTGALLSGAVWVARLVGGPDYRFLTRLVLWAFMIRAFLAIAILELFDVPASLIGDDASLYDENARAIAEAWRSGVNPPLHTFVGYRTPGHFLASAAIYFVLGEHPLLARLFVVFLGSLVPLAAFVIGREVTDAPATRRSAAVLSAVLPELTFYSALHLKDVPIALAFTVSLAALLRLRRTIHPGAVLALLISLGYLTLLRAQFALAVLVIEGVWVAYFVTRRHRVLGLTLVSAATPGVLWLFSLAVRELLNLEHLVQDPIALVEGQYQLLGGVERSATSFYSIFGAELSPLLIPLGIAYLLGAPFILWVFLNPTEFLNWVGFVIAMVWYPLIPFAVYGAVASRRTWREPHVVATIVTFLLALTAAAGGLGSMGRWKVPLLPTLLVYASEGLRAYRTSPKAVEPILVGFGLALSAVLAVYIHVKLFEVYWLVVALAAFLALYGLGQRVIRR